MKGDYHRYLAEFKAGADKKESADLTLNAYKEAQVRQRSGGIERPGCLGYCPTRIGPDSSNPLGLGIEFLGVLLRDFELARKSLSPGEAGD